MQCALNIYQHLISFVVLQMKYMLPFWHYDCINIDHTARGSIFHTVSFHHTSRLRGYGKCSPKGWLGGCQCCLGDIVLYCMLSLTPAEFVWTRIWSISGFYFFLFSSFFFVLLCNLAEMEVRYFWQLGTLWRQHSGDSAEPLFARVYQHIGVPLSPVSFHRQTGKGDWHKKGEKRRWDFEHAVAEGGASCFIARYLCHFFFKQKLKPVLFQGTQMANFTKDTHQSLRADNDFCKE